MEIQYKQYISAEYENVIVDISIHNNFLNADNFKDEVEEQIKNKYFHDDIWTRIEPESDAFRKPHRLISAKIAGNNLIYTITEKKKGSTSELIAKDSIPINIHD